VVQEVVPVRANRRLARLIGCTVGSQWMRISAVRRIRQSHLPICHVDIYLLPEFAGVAELMGRRTQPVYEMIEREFGHRVADVRVEIRAGLVTETLAPILEVPAGSPSLQVVRRYCGEDRKIFEVSVSEHPAERYTYSVQLRRGWQSGSGGAGSWTT
jgi:DNA-binding GntR family transcriptional regulator